MPGKVPPEDLRSTVFRRLGRADPAVVQGPADGEDAAAIEVGGETLVVSADPISLASSHVGTLGVHVACNDVAVSGVDPRWLTVVMLLPDGESLDDITRDVHDAATEVGAAVVGGHTEYVDQLERPILSLTAFGEGDYIPTGGATPGDSILLAGSAGIEGTAILAADFGEALGVDPELTERAREFLDRISVVPAASVLREHASAMHDPTEGGIVAGLQELARASSVDLSVTSSDVTVRPETDELCSLAGVDPLRIFGSGAVLATVPGDEEDAALESLGSAGIEATVIGTVSEGTGTVVLDGTQLKETIRDDLYSLWEDEEAG